MSSSMGCSFLGNPWKFVFLFAKQINRRFSSKCTYFQIKIRYKMQNLIKKILKKLDALSSTRQYKNEHLQLTESRCDGALIFCFYIFLQPTSWTYPLHQGKLQKSFFFNGSAIKALTSPFELNGSRKFTVEKKFVHFFLNGTTFSLPPP